MHDTYSKRSNRSHLRVPLLGGSPAAPSAWPSGDHRRGLSGGVVCVDVWESGNLVLEIDLVKVKVVESIPVCMQCNQPHGYSHHGTVQLESTLTTTLV